MRRFIQILLTAVVLIRKGAADIELVAQDIPFPVRDATIDAQVGDVVNLFFFGRYSKSLAIYEINTSSRKLELQKSMREGGSECSSVLVDKFRYFAITEGRSITFNDFSGETLKSTELSQFLEQDINDIEWNVFLRGSNIRSGNYIFLTTGFSSVSFFKIDYTNLPTAETGFLAEFRNVVKGGWGTAFGGAMNIAVSTSNSIYLNSDVHGYFDSTKTGVFKKTSVQDKYSSYVTPLPNSAPGRYKKILFPDTDRGYAVVNLEKQDQENQFITIVSSIDFSEKSSVETSTASARKILASDLLPGTNVVLIGIIKPIGNHLYDVYPSFYEVLENGFQLRLIEEKKVNKQIDGWRVDTYIKAIPESDDAILRITDNTAFVIKHSSCTQKKCKKCSYVCEECISGAEMNNERMCQTACPNNCSGQGQCLDNGVCTCNAGFRGEDCSKKTCPKDCSAQGVCSDNGVCTCNAGFRGDDCSKKTCPKDCSGQGQCLDNGVCTCNAGFRGEDCSKKTCPNDCTKKGYCSENGVCTCNTGFRGEDCSDFTCPNSCSNHGQCRATGACLCNSGYLGDDCSLIRCPSDCFLRGSCDLTTGTCTCDQGFRGLKCDELDYSHLSNTYPSEPLLASHYLSYEVITILMDLFLLINVSFL